MLFSFKFVVIIRICLNDNVHAFRSFLSIDGSVLFAEYTVRNHKFLTTVCCKHVKCQNTVFDKCVTYVFSFM